MHDRVQTAASIGFAILLVMSMVAVASPVAAQSDDAPFFDGLVDGEASIVDTVASKAAGFSGWIARQEFGLSVADLGDDSDTGNATTYAESFQTEFNDHNESIETYANQRLNATDDYDVFVVYFHDKDGGNVTRYVVANASNGNWSNARVVTPTQFEDLNRSEDHWISADWYASKYAGDELDGFVEDYAKPNEDLTKRSQLTLVAKYGTGLESDLWNSESDT